MTNSQTIGDAGLDFQSDALSRSWTPLGPEGAERLVRDHYGIDGSAHRLSSERDETFRFVGLDGSRHTLKIANPAEDQDTLRFQDEILRHLERAAPEIPVPRVITPLSGGTSVAVGDPDASTRIMRLLSYLEGEQQYRTPTSESQCRNVGHMLAALGIGLSSFTGPTPDRKLLWDISHTLDLQNLLGAVDPARRPTVARVLADYADNAVAPARNLRRQVIHNDFNPHNVLVDPSLIDKISGIIDFGDMVVAPLVNDLAVALSYQVAHPDWTQLSSSIVAGFVGLTPLTREEVEILPTLVKARLAMTITITEWRAAAQPENRAYILRNHDSAWLGLERLAQASDADLRTAFFSNGEA